MGAICVIIGAVFLIPAGMHVRECCVLHLSKMGLLSEPHTFYVLYVEGRTVEPFTLELIVTVVGALLLVAGVKILRKKSR